MITVAVSGYFDPLTRNHLNHFDIAKLMGDYLVVILSKDEDIARKRLNTDLKNARVWTLEERIDILMHLKPVNEVVVSVDTDGSVAETLKLVKPNIFAKGYSRYPSNMPEQEIKACQEIGCRIVYNVGGHVNETHSSDILRRLLNR